MTRKPAIEDVECPQKKITFPVPVYRILIIEYSRQTFHGIRHQEAHGGWHFGNQPLILYYFVSDFTNQESRKRGERVFLYSFIFQSMVFH